MVETAKLIKCSCINSGQDKLHGSAIRVYNKTQGKGSIEYYRCTVCHKEISQAK